MRQNQPQVDGRTHTTNTPHQTDSELKGRWTDPLRKIAIFGVLESRRVGASRCLSVARDCASVDSTPKKIQPDFFFWRVWAGFLPLASYLISGTVLKSERQQPEFGLSGFAFNAKSKSVEFFCCLSLLDPRLEARGTASALARGRSRSLDLRLSSQRHGLGMV